MRTFLALILLAAPPLAQAEDRQHGNLIFTLPSGWVMGRPDDQGVLTLRRKGDDLACKYCTFHLTAGMQSKARLDSFLFSERFRFVEAEDRAGLEVLTPPQIQREDGHEVALMGQKAGDDLQVFYAVKLPHRLELISFDGPAYDADQVAQTMAVFQADGMALIGSLRFASEGAAALMPTPKPGDLTGLYSGYRTGWILQLDGTMQMELQYRNLVFWPNGMFYDGTPENGISMAPDVAALLAKGDMRFGSYRLTGRQVILSFASGEQEKLDLSQGSLQDGDRALFLAEPLPDDSPLDGFISSFFYSGFSPGSGLSGGMTSSSSTYFSPDGRYSATRFGGATATSDSGVGTTSSSNSAEAGKYAIRDGLLILSPDDGSAPIHRLIYRNGQDVMIGDQILQH